MAGPRRAGPPSSAYPANIAGKRVLKPEGDGPGGSTVGPPAGNGGGGGNGNGNGTPGCKCKNKRNGMQHEGPDVEYWDCQGGLQMVETDGKGCPLNDKYCKIQVGPAGGPITVLAGVAGVITIAIANFTWAKIRGLVLSAFDTSIGNADLLHTIGVTSIDVQGIENISGEVAGERFRADATGAGIGTQQAYRGTIGSAGGQVTIGVINRSLVTVVIGAAVDVNAIR